MPCCDPCKAEFTRILEERVHLVLADAREEDARLGKDPNDDDSTMAHAQAHCFHFMELQGVLKGKPGVYKQVLK